MFANSGVKNGILLGIVYLVYSQVCYMINPKWILNAVAFFGYVLIIFFMYRSAVEEKRNNEGFLSFGEALKATFTTYVIGTFFYASYIYLMFNVFDPSLQDTMREVSLETAEYFANLAGGNEEQMDLVHDQLEDQEFQMSFSLSFLNYLIGLIFPGFVLALVISAITKKVNDGDTLDS
ncbi:MAG: DUF4199 domain-containing protein [Bacteroidota bacterium]